MLGVWPRTPKLGLGHLPRGTMTAGLNQARRSGRRQSGRMIEIAEISEPCQVEAALDKQPLLVIKARNASRGESA